MWLGAFVAASELARERRGGAGAGGAPVRGLVLGDQLRRRRARRCSPRRSCSPCSTSARRGCTHAMCARSRGSLVVGGAASFALAYLHGPHGRDSRRGSADVTSSSSIRAEALGSARERRGAAEVRRARGRARALRRQARGAAGRAARALRARDRQPPAARPLERGRARGPARLGRARARREGRATRCSSAPRAGRTGATRSTSSRAVRTSWPLVESLERFDVYRNPAHSGAAAGQAALGEAAVGEPLRERAVAAHLARAVQPLGLRAQPRSDDHGVAPVDHDLGRARERRARGDRGRQRPVARRERLGGGGCAPAREPDELPLRAADELREAIAAPLGGERVERERLRVGLEQNAAARARPPCSRCRRCTVARSRAQRARRAAGARTRPGARCSGSSTRRVESGGSRSAASRPALPPASKLRRGQHRPVGVREDQRDGEEARRERQLAAGLARPRE